MTDRRLDFFDKQIFQTGIILHLSATWHLCPECIEVDSCGKFWALDNGVNFGGALRDHVVYCLCNQQMNFYFDAAALAKLGSTFLFSFDELNDYSSNLEERAALDGFFMKQWMNHMGALWTIMLELQDILNVFKNDSVKMWSNASKIRSFIETWNLFCILEMRYANIS